MKRQVILGKPIPNDRLLNLLKTPGGRIAVARHALGLSQWDLAEKVHRSQALISLWERGRVTPDAEDLRLLAKALRCTQSYITTDPVVLDETAA